MKKRQIHIVFIAGIRSHYIKIASIQHFIKTFNESSNIKISPTYINAGQHYDYVLAEVFIKELGIEFDYSFSYKKKTPENIFGKMYIKLFKTLSKIEERKKINGVVVFGDANTSLTAALVSSKKKIPLIHIESGVRTFDKNNPEELNRKLIDHIADLKFTSSKIDFQNLVKEGISNETFWSGDIVYDLVLQVQNKLNYHFLNYESGEFILCTIHREENLINNSTLINLFNALGRHSIPVFFVAHPRTGHVISNSNLSKKNITVVEGLSYMELLTAIKNCSYVITDSGALQRESYYLEKRCLVLQQNPFWKSLIDAGIHKPIENSESEIFESLILMEKELKNPYPTYNDLGEGGACNIIFKQIVKQMK